MPRCVLCAASTHTVKFTQPRVTLPPRGCFPHFPGLRAQRYISRIFTNMFLHFPALDNWEIVQNTFCLLSFRFPLSLSLFLCARCGDWVKLVCMYILFNGFLQRTCIVVAVSLQWKREWCRGRYRKKRQKIKREGHRDRQTDDKERQTTFIFKNA